jgi:hypothetical protein
VLTALRVDVLRPKAIATIVDRLVATFAPPSVERQLARGPAELATLDREMADLTRRRRANCRRSSQRCRSNTRARDTVAATLAQHEAVDCVRLDRPTIDRTVRQAIEDWRTWLIGRDVDCTRAALRELLVGDRVHARRSDVSL